MLIRLFISEVGQEFHLHVKHLPRSPSQFSKSFFISPSRSWVCYICVSDVRQTLEAPQKEKHKKNKEKHKTKKEHRRRKEKVSTFWGSWDWMQALMCLLLSCRQAPPCPPIWPAYLLARWGQAGLCTPWQKGNASIFKSFVFLLEYFNYSVALRTVYCEPCEKDI